MKTVVNFSSSIINATSECRTQNAWWA